MQPATEILFLMTYLGTLSTVAILTLMLLKQSADNAKVIINVNNHTVPESDRDSGEDDDTITIAYDDEDCDDDEEVDTEEETEPVPAEEKKDD